VSTNGRPDPARGERFLRKLLTEDPAHLDVASDEEVERQMDAAGVTVKSVPSVEELMALAEKHAKRGEHATMAAPSPSPEAAPVVASPPVRRPRPGAMVAAVALGALGVAAVANQAAIVAYVKGEPIGPDRPWAPPTATPEQRAASIRGQAFAACDALRWTECVGRLDEAAVLDPAGESDPRVVSARRAVHDATRDEETPTKPRLK
jgi:hypothetical protein